MAEEITNPFNVVRFRHEGRQYKFDTATETLSVMNNGIYEKVEGRVLYPRISDPTDSYVFEVQEGEQVSYLEFSEPRWWASCRLYFETLTEEFQGELQFVRFTEWRKFMTYLQELGDSKAAWLAVYNNFGETESSEFESFEGTLKNLNLV